MPESVDLSLALPILLSRAHLSQAAAAYVLDVNNSTMQRWCSGTPVPEHALNDLAFVLGTSVQAMLELQRGAELAIALGRPTDPVVGHHRLEGAGMLPRAPEDHVYELACLLCGRGVGRDGVLRPTRAVPHFAPPCRFCGGMLLCREIGGEPVERLMQRPLEYSSDERKVA